MTPAEREGAEFVKLYVLHENGKQELLELALPISVSVGMELWRISDAEGTDQYFTKEGYYDGFGKGI